MRLDGTMSSERRTRVSTLEIRERPHETETDDTTAAGGGAAHVSPSFGAALWVADYTLRAVSSNIKRVYFHHGTIGNCQYCWWNRDSVASPYYGAYFAAAAVAGGSHIAILDDGIDEFGVYAVYSSGGKLLRIALFSTEFYDGNGLRLTSQFDLNGLDDGILKIRRLTAPSALSRADRGQKPSYDGLGFTDGNCKINGKTWSEIAKVEGGRVTVSLAASEAMLLDL